MLYIFKSSFITNIIIYVCVFLRITKFTLISIKANSMKLTKKIVFFIYEFTVKLFNILFATLGGYYNCIKAAFVAISAKLYISRTFVTIDIFGILSVFLTVIYFIWPFTKIESSSKLPSNINNTVTEIDFCNSPLESFNVYIEENFIFFSNISINIFLVFSIIIFFFFIFQ